jgi:methionyl-tRNA synthetase
VLGYISATKQWALENNQDWKKWWQDMETRYLAFIGKDNIVFHTIIFPVMLHGKSGYILPDNVPAHEFLNLEGEKFSKSRGWSIDLKDFYNDFKEPQWNDALRYTLAMNFPETRDSDFTWKDFQARNNNELSAILGNFVNRTMVFLHKTFAGKLPELTGKYAELQNDWKNYAINPNDSNYNIIKDKYGENDANVIKALVEGLQKIKSNYERFRFRDAITETMNVARAANKYFNDEEPWKSSKSDKELCAKTLFVCVQFVNSLGIIFSPVIPYSAKQIAWLLKLSAKTGEALNGGALNDNFWKEAAFPALESGRETEKPTILFGRFEDDMVEKQQSKLGNKDKSTVQEEELITIDDFMKVKFRTAKIIDAEKIKKSKKLLKLQVDTGKDKRQIIAGIAQHYEPEYLIGKTIVVVANLKPAKLMGHESNGMMLAASTDDGKLCFVTPECDNFQEGAEVR